MSHGTQPAGVERADEEVGHDALLLPLAELMDKVKAIHEFLLCDSNNKIIWFPDYIGGCFAFGILNVNPTFHKVANKLVCIIYLYDICLLLTLLACIF